jgi:hypothetical protein
VYASLTSTKKEDVYKDLDKIQPLGRIGKPEKLQMPWHSYYRMRTPS